MLQLNHGYGVNTEKKITNILFKADILMKVEAGSHKEIVVKHAKGGFMFLMYVLIAIIYGYIFFGSPKPDVEGYFLLSLVLSILVMSQIGYFSQKTYIIKNLSDDSVTVHIQTILKQDTRVYNKEENIRLKMFRFPRMEETVPERVALAILSGVDKIVFLPFAVPPFPFYPYGRYATSNSNWAKLQINEVKSAAVFLNIPLVEQIGELDYAGMIKSS